MLPNAAGWAAQALRALRAPRGHYVPLSTLEGPASPASSEDNNWAAAERAPR